MKEIPERVLSTKSLQVSCLASMGLTKWKVEYIQQALTNLKNKMIK